MPSRSPAGPLMHEHRVIERMIALLGKELQVMPSEGRADPAFLEAATDFLRTYADRCHHGKEEDILFRLLAEKDLDPELADDMAGLIEDHTFARTVTGRLIDANERYAAGDLSALVEIQDHIAALVGLYPVHIEKEDRHFFKPSLEYFSDDEKAQMLADFDEFDRALIHEKYEAVVARLEGRR